MVMKSSFMVEDRSAVTYYSLLGAVAHYLFICSVTVSNCIQAEHLNK